MRCWSSKHLQAVYGRLTQKQALASESVKGPYKDKGHELSLMPLPTIGEVPISARTLELIKA